MKNYPVNYLFISLLLTSSALLISPSAQAETTPSNSNLSHELLEINSEIDLVNPLLLNHYFDQAQLNSSYSPKILVAYKKLFLNLKSGFKRIQSLNDHFFKAGLSPPRP